MISKQPFLYSIAQFSDFSAMPKTNLDEFLRYGLADQNGFLKHLHSEYGDVVLMPKEEFGQDMVKVFHPDIIQELLQKEGRYPIGAASLIWPFNRYQDETGRMSQLGSAVGPEWKKLRSILQKNLVNPRDAQGYYPLLSDIADQAVNYMPANANQMGSYAPRMAIDLFITLMCGHPLNITSNSATPEDAKFVDNSIAVFKVFAYLMNTPSEITSHMEGGSTPAWEEFKGLMDGITDTSTRYTELALKRYAEGDELTANSYLGHRLRQLAKDDLGIESLGKAVSSFLFAGVDTTSNTLQWVLYNLANNPNAQETLRDEILSQLGYDKSVAGKDVKKIPYLNKFIKETYRLTPPVAGTVRALPEDNTIGGYDIPAYTMIQGSPAPYLTLSSVFLEPDVFNPSRWDRDKKDSTSLAHHPYMIMPFGKGKRMCLGARAAEVEISAIVCRLLQRYRLKLSPDSEVPNLDTSGGIAKPVPSPKYVFEPLQ